jgi:hypothetical protein
MRGGDGLIVPPSAFWLIVLVVVYGVGRALL